jgi:hypothetical protein
VPPAQPVAATIESSSTVSITQRRSTVIVPILGSTALIPELCARERSVGLGQARRNVHGPVPAVVTSFYGR